ncbi:MAG: glycosyltransferase family 9 protein [Planctomycetota bacterium]|jgi:ADP-heptose:LPS heptosyltransferase
MRDPRNILALRLGGIGEILVITPGLRAVRERYPDAHIALLGEEPAVDPVRGLGLVDEIIPANAVYRAQGLKWLASPKFYLEMHRLVRRITARRYDLFLNFNHLYHPLAVLKPLMVAVLSQARTRVGFDSSGRGFFLTHRVPDVRDEPRHLLYRNRDLLAPLGIVPTDDVEIGVRSEERAEADRLAAQWGLLSGRFVVGCHPGSSRAPSRWMPERFVEVLTRLRERYEARIVLVGSPGEAALCDRIMRRVPGAISFAGRTSIGSLAALMEHFGLFVSNDTGPMHIARACGVPTVGIFGPGEHAIWGTYRDPAFATVRRDVPCAPCYLKKCGHHTCMTLIEPDDVLEAVAKVLDQ